MLTASVNELLKPWPITATNVISARPIITAAAVDAVRAGFLTAFSRASFPASRRSGLPALPATKASGRTIACRDHRDADEHQKHARDEREQSRS